ncbi:MAG: Mrp/NBP35 family ATP-binding protein [Candidatus Jordarchaeaceae archaeon]
MENKNNIDKRRISPQAARMQEVLDEERRVRERMAKVKHKIIVMSGKGGVGKSTVAANLAVAMSKLGSRVGILDSDIHGPSIPKIMGVEGMRPSGGPTGIYPILSGYGVRVISIDLFLENSEDPVIWRGPLKMSAIRQFLSDVDWGELDYLFIDLPPRTGDEPLSVMQLLPNMDGAVIVTAPSDLSKHVVKKAINMSIKMNIPVIGIIENMSGFVCPKCGEKYDLLGSGVGKEMAEEMNVRFLGQIPIDPEISRNSDKGVSFLIEDPNRESSKIFMKIAQKIKSIVENENGSEK